jgi:ComF family protein
VRIDDAVTDVAEGLLELIAPTRCGGCELPGVLVCDTCASNVPLIEQGAACPRCGAPEGRAACAECADVDFAFSSARCAALLRAPLSRIVTVYKDGGERRLAIPLAGIATAAVGAVGQGSHSWVLVPVPASTRAIARRGFDHCERLASALGTAREMPVERVLLRRGGRDQRGLGREQRRANVGAAFTVVGEVPRRALLVDDVVTTGATLDAAARTLLDAGAEEVRAVALARAVGVCPAPSAPATLGDASTRLWLRTRERPSPG